MKKIIAIVFASLLTGCATNGFTPSQQITVDNVVAWSKVLCKYVPDVIPVINIIAANPLVGTAESIAQAICGVVLASSRKTGIYNGIVINVPVTGHFLSGTKHR